MAQPLVLDVVCSRSMTGVATPFRTRKISLTIGISNSWDRSGINSRVINPEEVVTLHGSTRLVSEEGERSVCAVLTSFAHLVS